MKKYLGLVAILAIATLSLANVVRAEDSREGDGQFINQIGMPPLDGQGVGLRQHLGIRDEQKDNEDGNDNKIENENENENEGNDNNISEDGSTTARLNLKNLTKEQMMQMRADRIKKMQDMIATIKSDRETFKNEIENDKVTFKAELETKKAEMKKFNIQQKQELRDNANLMLSEGFNKNLDNMKNLVLKVTAKIAEFKAKGLDVAPAESSIADANIQFASATDTIAKIKALIPTDGTKITVDIYSQIKTLAFNGKNFLKTAHLDLKNAVKGLKSSEGVELNSTNQATVETN